MGRCVAIAAGGIGTCLAVFIVVPKDDFEIRIELLIRPPHTEVGAVRLGAQSTAQERDEPLALCERPCRVVAVAGPRARFFRRHGPQSEEVTWHGMTIARAHRRAKWTKV